MKRIQIFALLFLIGLMISPVLAQRGGYDNMQDVDLQYRNRGEYFINGQRKEILLDKPWGAIVYVPEKIGKTKISSSFHEIILETPKGKITISDRIGGMKITYPGGVIEMEGGKLGGKIEFKGRNYKIELDSRRKMILKLPNDTITYRTDTDWLEISGSKGTVKYKKEENGYTVTSSAGTSTYKAKLDGGYEFDGVSPDKHPYGYWGMEFFLEDYQVGVVIEFNRLIWFPSIPRSVKPLKAIVFK